MKQNCLQTLKSAGVRSKSWSPFWLSPTVDSTSSLIPNQIWPTPIWEIEVKMHFRYFFGSVTEVIFGVTFDSKVWNQFVLTSITVNLESIRILRAFGVRNYLFLTSWVKFWAPIMKKCSPEILTATYFLQCKSDHKLCSFRP